MNSPPGNVKGAMDPNLSIDHIAPETPRQTPTMFKDLPSDVVQKIFKLLDAQSLSAVLEVSKSWSKRACEYALWEDLDLELYDSIEADKHLLHLLNKIHAGEWYGVVRKVRWGMQSYGRGVNLRGMPFIAHHLTGNPGDKLPVPHLLHEPAYLNVSRLQDVVLPDAALFYLVPYEKGHYCHYIKVRDTLKKRGIAKIRDEFDVEVILCPPCEYVSMVIGYNGPNMLAIRQHSTIIRDGNWP